jgi:hypothetical protein
MKTRCPSIFRAAYHSFDRAVFAGAVLLISFSALAQNLFEADRGSGNIYEFTPGGVRSTFASGLNNPLGLAFDSAGDLFEADYGSGNIYEFTPGGAQTTFASGLSYPAGLAFQTVPEPSALGLLAVGAAAFLVRRHRWHP